jgi:hypothetical protein
VILEIKHKEEQQARCFFNEKQKCKSRLQVVKHFKSTHLSGLS